MTRYSLAELSPALRERIGDQLGERLPTHSKSPLSLPSPAEEAFAAHCRMHKLPPVQREYLFAKDEGKGYRIDFAWDQLRVGVEVEGLVVKRINGELMVGGRHAHPAGFRRDCIKYAHAAKLGWTLVRFERDQVMNGTAIDWVIQILRSKGWNQ